MRFPSRYRRIVTSQYYLLHVNVIQTKWYASHCKYVHKLGTLTYFFWRKRTIRA